MTITEQLTQLIKDVRSLEAPWEEDDTLCVASIEAWERTTLAPLQERARQLQLDLHL